MKKVKLNDLGRGVHFFLDDKNTEFVAIRPDTGEGVHFSLGNLPEGKRVEFVVIRHFPECAEAQAPDGYTLVEAAEDLFQAPFDKGGCNDWRTSSLRQYLNGSFLDNLLDAFPKLKDAAVTFLRDLTSDDGLKDYGTCVDTVSMLTADEYRENRDLYMEAHGTWRWLITPDSTPSGGGSSFARYVYSGGSLNYNSAYIGLRGVRPVLYLKSGLLVSVEGVDECKDELTPEQKEMALYEAAVEKFGKKPQLLVAIEEMSELSKALLKYIRNLEFDHGDAEAILKNINEERADVAIMLSQLEVIFGENTEAEGEKLDHLADLVGLPRLGLSKKEDDEEGDGIW